MIKNKLPLLKNGLTIYFQVEWLQLELFVDLTLNTLKKYYKGGVRVGLF